MEALTACAASSATKRPTPRDVLDAIHLGRDAGVVDHDRGAFDR
jgi:hypothetical protein